MEELHQLSHLVTATSLQQTGSCSATCPEADVCACGLDVDSKFTGCECLRVKLRKVPKVAVQPGTQYVSANAQSSSGAHTFDVTLTSPNSDVADEDLTIISSSQLPSTVSSSYFVRF